MITSEELVEEVVVVRGERGANGGFGRGPGSADCGEPYWDPARGQPGGSREKSQTECSGREPLYVPRRAPVLIEWPRLEDGSGWVENPTRHGSTQLRGRRGLGEKKTSQRQVRAQARVGD